ncbi:GyrI-like domain-containing protein [Streptomyces sp. NPDC056007]|uniref:GyrI-like domain-containing protein n=1 Tax=Streptomyces sp. NPDC056007 TaxID=3345678 RepID=UPI0035D84F5A
MLDRLNEAMEYLESHLGGRIEAADLARTAMTSEYHFRRMFSAPAGVPLAEYIRRRRMTLAGAEAFRVVGRRARVPLIHEGPNQAIAEFVRGIGREELDRIEALSDQEPAGLPGVSDQLDPSRAEGTELDYHHGVVTGRQEPPADWDSLAVPAGSWAVFESEGEFPQALQHLWRDVFTQWFPSNPYASRPGPEILRVRLYEEGKRAEAELWIPVERAHRGPSA